MWVPQDGIPTLRLHDSALPYSPYEPVGTEQLCTGDYKRAGRVCFRSVAWS